VKALLRSIIRDTLTKWRGRDLVIKVTREGLRIKGRREHWENAPLLPWGTAYDVAQKLGAEERRAAARARRQRGKEVPRR
jgi:hypothetical protein